MKFKTLALASALLVGGVISQSSFAADDSNSWDILNLTIINNSGQTLMTEVDHLPSPLKPYSIESVDLDTTYFYSIPYVKYTNSMGSGCLFFRYNAYPIGKDTGFTCTVDGAIYYIQYTK